jgi:hypothetical protein
MLVRYIVDICFGAPKMFFLGTGASLEEAGKYFYFLSRFGHYPSSNKHFQALSWLVVWNAIPYPPPDQPEDHLFKPVYNFGLHKMTSRGDVWGVLLPRLLFYSGLQIRLDSPCTSDKICNQWPMLNSVRRSNSSPFHTISLHTMTLSQPALV